MRDVLTKIINTVSGERAFNRVREISNFHRIQASPGYRQAAQHVLKRLAEDGLQVQIKTYPADGKTWYFSSKMFQEWDCKDGYLHLVEPANAWQTSRRTTCPSSSVAIPAITGTSRWRSCCSIRAAIPKTMRA